eukprot:jgi/Phyca11/17294/fgenesh1_pg.PHYCAscaffold_26_\
MGKASKPAFPTSTRSKKAVEDKLQALREMIAGSTGKPEWFELSKKERKELRDRHRVKSPNVSQDVYDELHLFLGRQKLQEEEMKERRQQHSQHMELLGALVSALTKNNSAQ